MENDMGKKIQSPNYMRMKDLNRPSLNLMKNVKPKGL